MIYFVQAGEKGPIKIGHTAHSDVTRRVREIQTASPFKLTILATCDGDKSDERALHERYKHLHSYGEWFLAKDDLLAHIAEFRPPPPVPEETPADRLSDFYMTLGAAGEALGWVSDEQGDPIIVSIDADAGTTIVSLTRWGEFVEFGEQETLQFAEMLLAAIGADPRGAFLDEEFPNEVPA